MASHFTHHILSERPVPGGRRVALVLEVGADAVPATLLLPNGTARAPAALLLHGYTSRKERMVETAGLALLAQRVASLAIDLPLHGEREGRFDAESLSNPLGLVRRWRAALEECSAALRFVGARPEVDGSRLALVGYSLGSFVGVIVAAREPSVRALVLAAGGDLPQGAAFTRVVRAVADPARAVRKLEGRPLLMVHGRYDRTVRPEQARRLFDAAGEPKELLWWDAGHILPPQAIERAAAWLKGELERASARDRGTGD